MTGPFALQPPTRAQVVEQLKSVLQGVRPREEVSAWADQWVTSDRAGIADDGLWELLVLASGVNLIDPVTYPERQYLYSADEIRNWVREIWLEPLV